MAQVTLGIGTSHSPMLSTPHEAHPHLAEPVVAGSWVPGASARAREPLAGKGVST